MGDGDGVEGEGYLSAEDAHGLWKAWWGCDWAASGTAQGAAFIAVCSPAVGVVWCAVGGAEHNLIAGRKQLFAQGTFAAELGGLFGNGRYLNHSANITGLSNFDLIKEPL